MTAKKSTRSVKPSVKSRTLNHPQASPPPRGAPASDQDPQRRLGNFEGAGETSRKGGRGGIVGQTTKQNHTDGKQ
jgi:hypothetical protein